MLNTLNSQQADNHILFTLLFFLYYQGIETIDINSPISQITDDQLIIAVSLLETLHGIDVPDEYLADKTKTIRKLSDEIRSIPKLSDTEFQTLRKPGLRELKAAINDGCPVLISLFGDEHYSAFFGYSRTHVFVMNPSLDFTKDGVGSLGCTVRKDRFGKIWDRWGIVVSE